MKVLAAAKTVMINPFEKLRCFQQQAFSLIFRVSMWKRLVLVLIPDFRKGVFIFDHCPTLTKRARLWQLL